MPDKNAFPNKDISFALGQGYNLGKAQNKSEPLTKFMDRFKTPHVTTETRSDYLKLSDQRQAFLKSQNGWFMRAPVEKGRRTRNTVGAGDCITYDLDYLTPEYLERLTSGLVAIGFTFFLHTTRSHTPEKPRARLILPVKGQIPPERYQAASRIIRALIDPTGEHTDKVSFRVAQMMFLPTVSKDMKKNFVFYAQPGELVDWKQKVADWEEVNGSADNIGNLPRVAGEDELRDSQEEAEDPLAKSGIVGNFCRAYSITELVMGKDGEAGLLADVYEPTEWKEGSISRMTYIHGTTSNGAVVYEDKFVYSHHGSDPAQDHLVNAFDLVRIHKFGEKDEDGKVDRDTPIGQRPSFKAMVTLCEQDDNYKIAVTEEKYDEESMFDDDDDQSWIEDETDDDAIALLVGKPPRDEPEHDQEAEDLLGLPLSSVGGGVTPRYERMVAVKPPKKWIATELELDKDGGAKSTLHNIATIVTNDARFFRKIAYNDFSNQVVLLRDIRTKSSVVPDVICTDPQNGMLWSDLYDLTIRAIIEAPNGKGKPGYGFKVNDRDLVGGVKLAAKNNSFHPIREQIEGWRQMKWDGEDRVGTFLQRMVGAPDTAFVREAFKMMMIASIARIEQPGCKFDYALILEGAQGIGKSTLIKLLYGEKYFGEIDVDLKDRKQIAEQIAGKWGNELPELSSLHKSEHNEAKHFMRRQDDDVRLSYDRSVTRLPRQCVFWGTTNDSKYLRDPTGNRSYWPVQCDGRMIDFIQIMRERDQLWAQVVRLHDEMRAKTPKGQDMALTLTGEALEGAKTEQERARKTELHEDWFEHIMDWVEEPVLLRQALSEIGRDTMVFDHDGMDPDETYVRRVGFTQKTAFEAALDFGRGGLTDNMKNLTWGATTELLKDAGWKRDKVRLGAGAQQRYFLHPDASAADRARGFYLIGPDGSTESDPEVDDLL